MTAPTLLTLPSEIRTSIYSHLGFEPTPFSLYAPELDHDQGCCEHHPCDTHAWCRRECTPSSRRLPTFIRTCRQVYNECMDLQRSHMHVHVKVAVKPVEEEQEEKRKGKWGSSPNDASAEHVYPLITIKTVSAHGKAGVERHRFSPDEKEKIPMALRTCKNMVLSVFGWEGASSEEDDAPKDNSNHQAARAVLRHFLGALNVQKLDVVLVPNIKDNKAKRRAGSSSSQKKSLSQEQLQLLMQWCLEEIPTVGMFRISEKKLRFWGRCDCKVCDYWDGWYEEDDDGGYRTL